MSQAEASRLGVHLSDGPGLHRAASIASSVCSDLARWALERNCLLGPLDLAQDLGPFNDHNQRQQQQHNYFYHSKSSSLNNVTTIAQLQQQQHTVRHIDLQASTGNGQQSAAGLVESPLSQLVENHLLEPMHYLESKVNYYFSDIWLSSGDERTNKLPFIGAGPWKLVYATLIYLYLIKWLLPRVMQSFKPLELNWLIRLYNLFMVVSNMWAFYHGARILQFGVKCFGCETINHRDHSPQAIELLHYGWLFFLSRLVEWLDTIFFVLRKKERQVTKLHVFHHSFVPLISWTYLKYHPGYTVAFFPFVNSFVHSIMYTYYLLATFGPQLQPYLWWKRYLTSLQIVQFVLIIIQLASIPLTGDETCKYPRGFLYVAFAGAILFLWLFYTYYLDTYTRSKQRNTTSHEANGSSKHSMMKASSKLPREREQVAAFGMVRDCRARNHREGSSRSLSDAVDNAISCDELPPSPARLWKTKSS